MSLDAITNLQGGGGSEGADGAGFDFAGLSALPAEALTAAASAGNANESAINTGAKTTNLVFGNQSKGFDQMTIFVFAGLAALFILKRK